MEEKLDRIIWLLETILGILDEENKNRCEICQVKLNENEINICEECWEKEYR